MTTFPAVMQNEKHMAFCLYVLPLMTLWLKVDLNFDTYDTGRSDESNVGNATILVIIIRMRGCLNGTWLRGLYTAQLKG